MSYIKKLRKYVGHEPILTAGVGLFVVNDENKVLMQLRTDYNAWGFPGGSMELGESFEDTARRELKEETNLEIDELKIYKIISGKETYREYPNGDKLYDITAIIIVKKYHGEIKINDDESKKLDWFPINELPENISEFTQNYLKNIGDLNNLLNEATENFDNNKKITLPTHCVSVAGIVLNSENKILMVNTIKNGWTFPGGIVENGENIIDALKREIYEESGINIDTDEIFCISSNTKESKGYNGIKEIPTIVNIDFICKYKDGALKSSEETTNVNWFSEDEALSTIKAPHIKERFEAYLNYKKSNPNKRPLYIEYQKEPEFIVISKENI